MQKIKKNNIRDILLRYAFAIFCALIVIYDLKITAHLPAAFAFLPVFIIGLMITAILSDIIPAILYTFICLSYLAYHLQPFESLLIHSRVEQIRTGLYIIISILIIHQIKKNKHNQMEAENIKVRYETLIDKLNHAVVMEVDAITFAPLFVNQKVKLVLGYTAEQLVDWGSEMWKKIIAKEDYQTLISAFQNAYVFHHIFDCEVRLKKSNGDYIWLQIGGQLAQGHESGKAIFSTIFFEITFLKRAIAFREEILAIVSHDLRNPLSAIRLRAELLKRDATQKVQEQAAVILSLSYKMENMINDFLDFARIDAGKFYLDPNELCGKEIIQEAVDLVQESTESKKLRISINYSTEFLVYCNRAQLVRALTNILSNAIKFSVYGGEIRISAHQSSESIKISIQDSGEGMAQEEIEHIFDLYWQSPKQRKGGFGLGLMITKGIIEAHQGKILTESELGKGTTVTIVLPRQEDKSLPWQKRVA